MSYDNRIRANAIAPNGPGGPECPCCRLAHRPRGSNGRARAARVNAVARRLARRRAEEFARRDLVRNPD